VRANPQINVEAPQESWCASDWLRMSIRRDRDAMRESGRDGKLYPLSPNRKWVEMREQEWSCQFGKNPDFKPSR